MPSEVKSKQSFGHKRSFHHNLNCASNKKTYFTKVAQFGSLSKEISSEVKSKQSFGHNRSFRHNLNCASNQKTCFSKVVQFCSLS
jgi:hypothetical protein